MELEYGLVENALDSLREAMNYYNEGDGEDNANQYKFSMQVAFGSTSFVHYTNPERRKICRI